MIQLAPEVNKPKRQILLRKRSYSFDSYFDTKERLPPPAMSPFTIPMPGRNLRRSGSSYFAPQDSEKDQEESASNQYFGVVVMEDQVKVGRNVSRDW